MVRTYVVTGSASGIGLATKQLLIEQGHRVIGVDIADAEVTVDLGTAEGRSRLVDEVAAHSGGTVDAVLAIAGLASPTVATAAVNYFGTVATLEGLRPLLLGSAAPRAVAVSSMAALFPPDDELLDAFTAMDEPAALARAEVLAVDRPLCGRPGSRAHTDDRRLHRHRRGQQATCRDGADAAERVLRGTGCRRAAGVAHERGQRPPMRPDRLHRRRLRRGDARRQRVVTAKARVTTLGSRGERR